MGNRETGRNDRFAGSLDGCVVLRAAVVGGRALVGVTTRENEGRDVLFVGSAVAASPPSLRRSVFNLSPTFVLLLNLVVD